MSSSESITVNLAQQYDVSNIQSIVVYSPTGDSEVVVDDVLNGCVIELLNEDDVVLYSTPIITQGKRYNRFDGADISNASFSETSSISAIIEPPTGESDKIQTWDLTTASKSSPSFTNTLVESIDGVNWNTSIPTKMSKINSVVWNGSRWLIGGEGSYTLAYSLGGNDWTDISSSVFDSHVSNISYDSKTPYVNIQHPVLACMEDSKNTLAYSVDGIRWNGLGNSIFSEYGTNAFWNGYMWVAVGKGSNTIAYSLNLLDWIGLGSTLFSVQGNSVHYAKNKWVAVGSGTDHTIGYSYDGFNWKGLGKSIFSVQGNSCAYNGSIWVSVGEGTEHTMAISTDGITWTGLSNTIFSVRGTCVIFTGTLWLATGSGTNTLAYSEDGTTWVGLGLTIFSTQGNSVSYDDHKLMAVGEGTNTIASSEDGGLTWVGKGLQTFSIRANNIEYNGKWWMACGEGTHSFVYSNTGESWKASTDDMFTNSLVKGISVNKLYRDRYIPNQHYLQDDLMVDVGNSLQDGITQIDFGYRTNKYNLELSKAESTNLTVSLVGSNTIYVERGDPYIELGVSEQEGYTISTSGIENTNISGTYFISYYVKNYLENVVKILTRKVVIEDTQSPIITLLGDDIITIEKDFSYIEPGYSAIDYYEENITSRVVVNNNVDTSTPGTYYITYNVKDNDNNVAGPKIRTIIVQDTTLPVITLSGEIFMRIDMNTPYIEPGYIGSDFDSIDLTDSVVVTGNVDVSNSGVYDLTYSLSDPEGNEALVKTRKIEVVDTSVYNVLFNKIKLVGEDNTQGAWDNAIGGGEFQVWVQNVNIMQNNPTIYFYPRALASYMGPNQMKDNILTNKYFTTNYVNPYILITFDQGYTLSELNSIVLYRSFNNATNGLFGCKIYIMNEADDVLYKSPLIIAHEEAVRTSSLNAYGSYTISGHQSHDVFRFDGPSIDTANKSATISTTAIFDPPNNDGEHTVDITTIDLNEKLYHWYPVRQISTGNIYNVKCNTTGQYIYIATSSGIWRSSDYGENWNQIPSTNIAFETWRWGISISADGQTVFIVGNDKAYISTDYGVSWGLPHSSYPSGYMSSCAMSSNGEYIIVPIRNADTRFWTGMWASYDYGTNWTRILTSGYNWVDCAMSSSGQYSVAVSYDNPIIWISNDYIQTFNSVYTMSSVNNWWIIGCAMSHSGQYVAVSTARSIFISSDYGQNWVSKLDLDIYFQAIAMDSTGQYMETASRHMTTATYIYYSEDYGETWQERRDSRYIKRYEYICMNSDATLTVALAAGDKPYIRKRDSLVPTT